MHYTHLSTAYDALMAHVDYPQWAAHIQHLIDQHKPNPKLVLDLACGTATLTTLLPYEMIAIDHSVEMLLEAKQKAAEAGKDILFLHQDMLDFELYGTVDVIICTCDGLNYLTEDGELLQVFKLVNNYLDPGGIFIFDLNSPYKYEHLLGNQRFSQVEETTAMIWENTYDPDTHINEYDVNLFTENPDGTYTRSEETHYQRAYDLKTVKTLLTEAGLAFVAVTDGYTSNPAAQTSERFTFIAKEITKS